MDTVGTFPVAHALAEYASITAMPKHIEAKEWVEFAAKNPQDIKHMCVSSGVSEEDFKRMTEVFPLVSLF